MAADSSAPGSRRDNLHALFPPTSIEVPMAQWRDVAKAFAIADGHITQKEVSILRKALLADGNVSKSEIDFLREIKVEAKSSVQLLDDLITDCEKALG